MSLTAAYARFRGSAWFLLALCFAITLALAAHRWFAFDPGYGIINLCLSIEASVSVALLIMANERQEAAEEKRLRYMLHLLEANRELLSVVHRGLAGHAPDDGCVDAPDTAEAAD